MAITAMLGLNMKASAAVNARLHAFVADATVFAEHASEELRVFADAARWLVRKYDAFTACQQPQAELDIVFDPLGIERIGVFARSQIQAARQAESLHSKLALGVMQGLGLLAAVLLKFLDAFLIARLEFQQVLGLRRFGHAHCLAVALAAHETRHQPDFVLLPVDVYADALEVGDQAIFLDIAGGEQPNLAARMNLVRRHPAKAVPQGSIAFRACLAHTDAPRVPGLCLGLVSLINGADGTGFSFREGCQF